MGRKFWKTLASDSGPDPPPFTVASETQTALTLKNNVTDNGTALDTIAVAYTNTNDAVRTPSVVPTETPTMTFDNPTKIIVGGQDVYTTQLTGLPAGVFLKGVI